LGGVSFGSFLIKQVVEEISREFPKLSNFVTLSPAPEFRSWIARERKDEGSNVFKPSDAHALSLLDEPGWFANTEIINEVRPLLCAAAAHYFLLARSRKGKPVDPVARFHLGNGARLERIDPMADLSEKGIAQSYGLMVNYRYVPDEIERNHEAYAGAGEIVASGAVRKLLRVDARQTALVPTA
jgi:malonyl-CoA decarboxylase